MTTNENRIVNISEWGNGMTKETYFSPLIHRTKL